MILDLKWIYPFLLLLSLSAAAGAVSALAGHPRFPCQPPHFSSFPFCDTSLPIPARARALVALLTLDEKIQQLSNNASAVPRLGLPPYEWWSESLHGVAANGPGVSFQGPAVRAATVFPQVILAAAAFNRTLWRAVARAVAIEARAMYNVGQAGLTYWAPNINIFRDPRWGRGQETPGEDPLVASEYAVEYVRGFQGEYDGNVDGGRLMLSACCKHYTAYDLEKWGNFSRYTFNAKVTEQDMEDTYQPPFRSCIEDGHASCLMCSYNQVNGVPACARGDLLGKARNEWGFEGYVTSDCDAVAIIYENQKYSDSPGDSIADVLKAGMDINCGTYLLRFTKSAVKSGKVDVKEIDRALYNLFSVQLRLGLYDGDPIKQQFGQLGPSNVCSQEHRELALEVARQGIVLLKNDNHFLPLSKHEVLSLAVIGPGANDSSIYGGGYTGVPCDPVSIFEGLQGYAPRTLFAPGCSDVPCKDDKKFHEAIFLSTGADIVVVVAGLNLTEETEDHDRASLLLPGKQMDLIDAITETTQKPIVLVLIGGGPIDVSFAKENPSVASIIWVGYPGEVGGQAVAEALFGDFNPGGRLPITWYPESFTNIPMNDMNMRADPSRGYPGRTYRFYTGSVVYGFGFGLSYSKYSYKFISVPPKVSLSGSPSETFIKRKPLYARKEGLKFLFVKDISFCSAARFYVKISVINNGDISGGHTVMLFSRPGLNFVGSPQKQLIGFERVHTIAHAATEIKILVDPCKHLSIVNKLGERILPLGTHIITVESLEHEVYVY